MDDCPFCDRIRAGDYDGDNHEGPWVVNFEPLDPLVPGHRIFIPARHVEDAKVDPKVTGATFHEAASWAVQHGTEDFNLITSAGPNTTQTIPHLHVHLVPRRGSSDRAALALSAAGM